MQRLKPDKLCEKQSILQISPEFVLFHVKHFLEIGRIHILDAKWMRFGSVHALVGWNLSEDAARNAASMSSS